MDKGEIRRRVLKQLKGQKPDIKASMDDQLLDKLLAQTSYQEATCLATYLAFDFEFDTSSLIEAALAVGKRVVVPKTLPKGDMIFVPYDSKHLVKNSFGLWEPISSEVISKDQIDLIHVPAVAVNQAGYRIGFGGGYYDRYLVDFKGSTLMTVYPCQQVAFEPEVHDIRIGKVLSCEK